MRDIWCDCANEHVPEYICSGCVWEEHEDGSDCDCVDAEFDILEGTLRCWRCGNVEHVSGHRYEALMKSELEAHEAFYEAMSAEQQ